MRTLLHKSSRRGWITGATEWSRSTH